MRITSLPQKKPPRAGVHRQAGLALAFQTQKARRGICFEPHVQPPITISAFMTLPFAGLLAAIALAPLFFSSWWGKHFPKVTGAFAAVALLYYVAVLHASGRVLHTASEYVSFIAFIGSLFVISGGIHITVKGEATPLANVCFLAVGAVLSNLLGTTGASMLLIRPWLRMNKYRLTGHHVIFFIFLVSNVGGSLTPVGDPPLFLGYLQGVPFWWVVQNCWPMWLAGVALLLAMFYYLDRKNFLRAPRTVREGETNNEKWKFDGLSNLCFLAIVLGSVFIKNPPFLREMLMIAAAAGSWFSTPKTVHQSNDFTFGPLKEIAILFAGIFATMMPALDWLQANASSVGNPSPALFFWASGALSSVLDNAPTYLSFFSTALGAFGGSSLHLSDSVSAQAHMSTLLQSPQFVACLKATSIGSVFFGANTYIGNGPNFMVKAIADQQKAHTPTFVGYIVKFTLPCMIPMLAIIWFLFFR